MPLPTCTMPKDLGNDDQFPPAVAEVLKWCSLNRPPPRCFVPSLLRISPQDRANLTSYDEGLGLLATFLLLAEAQAFIATECTTIRVLVNEIRWGTGDEAPPHLSLYPPKDSGFEGVKPGLRRLCLKCLRFYDHLTPLNRDKTTEAMRYMRVPPKASKAA